MKLKDAVRAILGAALLLWVANRPATAYARTAAPVIRVQPASGTNNAGTKAEFSVKATGQLNVYRWYKNDTNRLADGGNLSGAADANLTLKNVSGADTGAYSVRISNAGGAVTSSPATLTVLDPCINRPPGSLTNLAGTTATFTVTASGTTPAYQWFHNGDAIPGANARTFAIARVAGTDAGEYIVTVSNSFGCVTSAPPARLAVYEPPVIVQQPASLTNRAGATVTFTVTANGTSPAYQWYREKTPLRDGGNLSGATAASLIFTNISHADEAAYHVVLTNLAGAVTSAPPAWLTVEPADTVLAVASSENPAGFRDSVHFTAILPADATGDVVFKADGAVFDTQSVSNGAATSAVTTQLPRGNIAIVAEYTGDADHAGSTNGTIQIVTNHPPVAAPMTVTRFVGWPLVVSFADAAAHWSDVDGDTVTLDGLDLATANGVNLATNDSPFVNPGDGLAAMTNRTDLPPTNEVWISTNPVTADLGTADAPFDGSTVEKFDSRCAGLPPGTVIHLRPGTYQTLGSAGWLMKSGQQLLGSGEDATVLQLTGTEALNMLLRSGNDCSNILVSGLTLDANGSPGAPYTHYGITLLGTHHTIRRVRLINCVCGGTVREGWGIQIVSYCSTNPSDGNLIEDCDISQYQGPANHADLYAIVMNGGANSPITGVIRRNRVVISPAMAAFGIGVGRSHDMLVVSNYLEGLISGTHTEGPDSTTNTIFAYNTYRNCSQVLDIWDASPQNLAYLFNDIEIANGYYNFAVAFKFEPASTFSNIVIFGNRIRDASQPGANAKTFIEGYNVQGMTVAANCVDASLTNNLCDCANVSLFDNCDANGNYPATLNLLPTDLKPAALFGLDVTGAWLLYTNSPDADDQICYTITDGHGGTATGLINVVMNPPAVPLQAATTLTLDGALARLIAHGVGGYQYVTERTTNIAAAVWMPIATNTAAPNGTVTIYDRFDDLGGPPAAAFYRLKWQP